MHGQQVLSLVITTHVQCFAVRLSEASRQNLACGKKVHILACIVYNDIHNAWVSVCGTLCILYQDHKLRLCLLLLTTYLQSAVEAKEPNCM